MTAPATSPEPAAEAEQDDFANMPFVCPGCHCVGAEPHLPGCIDAEIEEALADRSWRDDFYDADLNDGEDWGWEP